MDLGGRRIAITGATGFVGRDLVRVLRERGARPVAVVRNPRKAECLGQDVEIREADLMNEAALRTAFRDVDGVCANAALISIGQYSWGQLEEVNVRGTLRVMRAMADAGVGRMVMTSSAMVYEPRRDHFYREDHPLRSRRPRFNRFAYYAASKAAAEREAWRLAPELGIELSSVRPHQIHGPFDGGGFTHWAKKFLRPPVTVFPSRIRLSSVYVGDLTEAMCRMLERPGSAGKAYNIAGDPEATYWDLLWAYAQAGGRRPRWILPIPLSITRRYDLTRAERDLGFTYRPLVDGFEHMLRLEAGQPPP